MQSPRRCSSNRLCVRGNRDSLVCCYNCNSRENVSSKNVKQRRLRDRSSVRCVLFSRSIGSGWAKISRLVHLISKTRRYGLSTFGSSCGNFLLSRWCVVNDDEIGVRVMPKRLQRLQIAVIVRDYKFLLSIATNSSTKLPSLSAVAYFTPRRFCQTQTRNALSEQVRLRGRKLKAWRHSPGLFY